MDEKGFVLLATVIVTTSAKNAINLKMGFKTTLKMEIRVRSISPQVLCHAHFVFQIIIFSKY